MSYGQLTMTRTTGHRDGITVDRADPCILIAPEVLAEVITGNVLPNGNGEPYAQLHGDTLKVNADNLRAIYRIVGYLPEERAYLAEWPD